MFRLNTAINDWCQKLRTDKIAEETIVEFKDHLLCDIEALKKEGLSSQEAFELAVQQLGNVEEVKVELSKAVTLDYKQLVIANISLFYSYFVAALRYAAKQPIFTSIKVLSIALGLLCAILVLAHVQYINSYDKHIPNWQNIYRLVSDSNGVNHNQSVFAVGDLLARDYGQIETLARVRPDNQLFSRTTSNGIDSSYNDFFWVDPSVVDLFSIELVRGNSATALAEANSILLNESTARKFFGEEDPIGQILTFDHRADLQVTGVMPDFPANTYLQIEAMITFETGRQIVGPDFMVSDSWVSFAGTQTFFSVPDKSSANMIANDLDSFLERNVPEDQKPFVSGQNIILSLEPLSDVYLSSRSGYNSDGGLRARVFYGLVAFAFLVLVTSCINFANLSVSQIEQRRKEIGIRRSIGASKSHIFAQFITESIALTFLGLIIVIPLVRASIPVYSGLTGTEILIESLFEYEQLFWIVALVLVTGLVSGIIPALSTTIVKPINVVRGRKVDGICSRVIRPAITIFQFSLSGALIVFAMGITLLIDHLNNMEMGFNRFDLVVLDNQFSIRERRADTQGWSTRNTALINDLHQHPGIISVSESSVAPPTPGWFNPWRRQSWPEEKSRITSSIGVDENYIETLQLNLIAGRGFSQNFPGDFITGARANFEQTYGAVITESAIDAFELNSPEQALGEVLRWGAGYRLRIVGVVEDLHFEGGLGDIEQSTKVLWATNQPGFYTLIRIDPRQTASVLEHIDSVWNAHRPETPVVRSFYEQSYNALVQERTNGVSQVSIVVATITICIALMGLYALAAYTTQRSAKEIGVRKAMGASSVSIVQLFTWRFIRPVFVACLISSIGGFLALSYFFSKFSSHPELSAGMFVVVSFGMLAIAVLTVSTESIRAANTKLVDSLRYE